MISGGHAKLHRRAGGRHRQIERVLKLDLLRLRQSERTADISKRFLRENDRAGTHRADLADKLNVFDGFGEELQAAAVLFEKAKTRAIDLTVDEQSYEPLVAQARGEGKFALSDVERRFRIAQPLTVEPRHIFERRVAHGGVVTIDVESAHQVTISAPASRISSMARSPSPG